LLEENKPIVLNEDNKSDKGKMLRVENQNSALQQKNQLRVLNENKCAYIQCIFIAYRFE
jgi:hypothetical protein